MTPTSVHLDVQELATVRGGLRIMALVRLGDAEAAEEVAQEAVVRVLEAWQAGRIRDPSRFVAFARGVARHVLVDLLRARMRHLSLDANPELSFPSVGPDALHALVGEEERRAVHLALSALPAPDRELLRLAFFEHQSPAEIARRLGITDVVVRKRKQRALERLRAAFQASAGHGSGGSSTEVLAFEANAIEPKGSA